MHSRCRWPPEKLVPPWLTGAVEPQRQVADKVGGLGCLRAPATVRVVRVGRADPQVLRDRAREEVGVLRDDRDQVPQDVQRHGPHVVPADADLAGGGSRNRGSRFSRVVLPLPVAPMIAVVVPGLAVKETPSSTGASAPG